MSLIGNLARDVREPGFFSERSESGPRCNVLSEGRHSQLSGVPVTVAGALLLSCPEDGVLPNGQQLRFLTAPWSGLEPYSTTHLYSHYWTLWHYRGVSLVFPRIHGKLPRGPCFSPPLGQKLNGHSTNEPNNQQSSC